MNAKIDRMVQEAFEMNGQTLASAVGDGLFDIADLDPKNKVHQDAAKNWLRLKRLPDSFADFFVLESTLVEVLAQNETDFGLTVSNLFQKANNPATPKFWELVPVFLTKSSRLLFQRILPVVNQILSDKPECLADTLWKSFCPLLKEMGLGAHVRKIGAARAGITRQANAQAKRDAGLPVRQAKAAVDPEVKAFFENENRHKVGRWMGRNTVKVRDNWVFIRDTLLSRDREFWPLVFQAEQSLWQSELPAILAKTAPHGIFPSQIGDVSYKACNQELQKIILAAWLNQKVALENPPSLDSLEEEIGFDFLASGTALENSQWIGMAKQARRFLGYAGNPTPPDESDLEFVKKVEFLCQTHRDYVTGRAQLFGKNGLSSTGQVLKTVLDLPETDQRKVAKGLLEKHCYFWQAFRNAFSLFLGEEHEAIR